MSAGRPPAHHVARTLVSTALLLRQALARALASGEPAATPAEWVLLEHLAERDGQRVGELADVTIRDRTTITRFADGLVAKGWIERRPDPEDRRAVRLWLTAAGRRRQARLHALADDVLGRALDDLGPRERNRMLEDVRRVRARLIGMLEEG